MSGRLAVRLIVTALGVSVALFCFFFAKYMLDVPNIRQLTLRAELAAIREAISAGRDPAAAAQYGSYPANYGLRVLAERPAGGLKVMREINPSVLPPMPKDYVNGESAAEESSPAEGVFDLGPLNEGVNHSDR
jgi:hypothetical protein